MNYDLHSDKKGLIRSFVLVVIGIVSLSFLGFDLRGEVETFQTDNQESITSVKEVLFGTIIPKTKDSIVDIKAFADENDITIENAKKLLNTLQEYSQKIDLEQYGIELPGITEKISE